PWKYDREPILVTAGAHLLSGSIPRARRRRLSVRRRQRRTDLGGLQSTPYRDRDGARCRTIPTPPLLISTLRRNRRDLGARDQWAQSHTFPGIAAGLSGVRQPGLRLCVEEVAPRAHCRSGSVAGGRGRRGVCIFVGYSRELRILRIGCDAHWPS